jgi:hypothetical protein
METIVYGEEVQAEAAPLDEWMRRQDNARRTYASGYNAKKEMIDMDTDTTLISLPLVGGGYYTGTVDDCLQFLYKHRTLPSGAGTATALIEDSAALHTYFHYSESKEQYVYIEHMHPNYIRNVLLKGLGLQEAYLKDEAGSEYMGYILGNVGLPNDLVAQAVRTWYELIAGGVDVHTEALLLALEGSEYRDDGDTLASSEDSNTTVLEGPGGKVTITQTGPFTIEVEVEGPAPSEVTGTEEYTVPGRELGPIAL